jgi:hypothetical protein
MHKCIKHNEVVSYKTVQQYIAIQSLLGPLCSAAQCPTIADQVRSEIDETGSKINREMINVRFIYAVLSFFLSLRKDCFSQRIGIFQERKNPHHIK